MLKEIFRRGEDVHTATAMQVFGVEASQLDAGMRSKAKMVNYGIVYGLTDFGLADRLQIPREEAAVFIATYFERFPAVREFIERTIAAAIEQGYVTTLLGRRRQIPELRARNRQQHALGERLAVNTVIQGTAADIIKVAMVRAHGAIADLRSQLILQIHDELLFEGPPDEIDAAARGGRGGDGGRLGARSAAGCRSRRRAQLARGEVTVSLRYVALDATRIAGLALPVAGTWLIVRH